MRSSKVQSLLLAATMFIGALLVGRCLAQVTTADIVGHVTDSSGGSVPGAKVTVTDAGTNATRSITSAPSGDYVVTLLPPGHYRVRIEANGFKTINVPDVALAISDRYRLDSTLEVGDTQQTVEVTAATPALQSEESSVGSLINEHAVQDLPLNGRNFVRLAQLAPGASEGQANSLSSGNRPDDRRQSSAVSVNGQDTVYNNYLIDGMDDNERFIGTVVVKPSMDALSQMKVETNLYSAEVGRSSAGVINLITKSGSDAFHGTLFEFFRNEKLDAKNFFAGPGPTPAFKQNQFGGSLGGPIRKDKTFFFGDYQGTRLRQGVTYTDTVPTLAMRQGNFAGINAIFDPLSTVADPLRPGQFLRTQFPNNQIPANRFDPAAAKLVNLYPVPSNNSLVNNFTYSPGKQQTDDLFDVRVDHRFSDKDSFFGRYSFNNTSTVLPPNLPTAPNGIIAGGNVFSFAGTTAQRAQAAQLNFIHTFSATWIMELKAGYERYATSTVPPDYGTTPNQAIGIPGATIDSDSSGLSAIAPSGFTGLGASGYIPIIVTNNVYQDVVNFTRVTGKHAIKFGTDIRRRQVAAFQSPFARGYFQFDPNFTNDPSGATASSGNSMASLLLGYPFSTQRAKYLVNPGLRLTEASAFVQDDWRATNWLTFNIGLRYDYIGPLTEVVNRISNVNFSTDQIVIAGQNGTSSSAGVQRNYLNFAPRFGFAAKVAKGAVLRGGYGINYEPAFIGSNLPLRNPPFVSLYAISTTPFTPINRLSSGLPVPVATSQTNPTGNLSAVAYDFKTPYVQQYNFTLQQELPAQLVATVSYVGALSRNQPMAYNANQAPPGPGAIAGRRPFAAAFPSLNNITYTGSWGLGEYQGLQTSLERRFSNGFSVVANYTWAHNIDNYSVISGGLAAGYAYPQLSTNRRPERGNSDLDIRQRFTALLDYQLPFAKSASGVAGLFAKGWEINLISVLQTGPVFTITNSAAQSNTGDADRPNQVGNPNLSGGQRSIFRWFNTAACARQSLYTVGNVGRNTLTAPGLTTLDLSLFKDFRVTERARLQFRAESFNITNTANFAPPDNALGDATFGVISSTGNNLPRNIQFALKLLF